MTRSNGLPLVADPIALTALALDAAVGWPDRLYRHIGHPVGLFARLIDTCEAKCNRPAWPTRRRRALGIFTVVLLMALAGGLASAAQRLTTHWFPDGGWLIMALLAWPALAQRSLYDHVRMVAQALEKDGLAAGRAAVGRVVGRDTATLDSAGVSRAALESLAESFCDGVAAPLFWLIVAGLPGVWIYKAVNTADSLIGHREDRWRAFGWAAARSDDCLNFIPARLAALAICLAGGGGARVTLRDARKHASPNAGWPEAAMAGALDIRLAGPIVYDGVMHDKTWIGDGRAAVTATDIGRGLRVYLRACALLWVAAGGAAWLF